MLDVFIDSLLDSLKVFGLAFIIYFIFSFIYEKVTQLFQQHQKVSPLIGAGCGLIPECGISIVGADMYHRNQLSTGTILAIFFACSDEAIFILCSDYKKILYVFPLLIIKFVFAFLLGYGVDKFYPMKDEHPINDIKLDCCGHHHKEEKGIQKHLFHPLFHCLKIFCYVFIVTMLFGTLIYYIGEDRILNFLKSNSGLSPLFACVVGVIPNCASSVLLSELFIMDALPFGALLTGLSVNTGLGLIYLFRFKGQRKKVLILFLILFAYSLIIGYSIYGIMEWIW